MKLSDYSKVTELANDNIFLIDTVNGTRTITAEALLKAISDTFSPKDIFEKIDLSTISSAIELEDNDLVFLGRAGGNKTMNAKEFLKTLQLDFTKLTEAEQINLTDKLLINDGTGNKSINVENLLKTLDFDVLTEVQEFAEDDNLIVSSPTEGNRKIPASQVGTKLDLSTLPTAETAADNDLILLGTSEGNKSIPSKALIGNILIDYDILDDFIAPEARAGIFRGKNLGTSFTEEQSARIKDGTFKGFFLGDYWEDTVNNVKWRIADFDYWLGTGPDNAINDKHHLVIVPDDCIGPAKSMNSSNTTAGGFYGSLLAKSEGIGDAINIIASFFGSNIITLQHTLSNSVSNGRVTSMIYVSVTAPLMNEIQVSGNYIFTATEDGSDTQRLITTNYCQFALFTYNRKFAVSDNVNEPAYWLCDVITDSEFGFVSISGDISHVIAGLSGSVYVRPCFAVG